MKIYFAGSIRGGRDDVHIYEQIIDMLKKYGEILTEHIADKGITSYGQKNLTNEEIYTKDTNWIRSADLIVAEVTNPSLGVGYEIGFAESLNKKIITLYRPTQDKRLSAMIAGNKNIMTINYTEVSELHDIFENIFK